MGLGGPLVAVTRSFNRIKELETLVMVTPHLRDDNGQIQNPHRQALTAARTGRHFRCQRERHAECYLHGTVAMIRSVNVRASESKVSSENLA
jgi:hypothetical protein